MKPSRWGIKDGVAHLYHWWKPDKHHWRDLSTDGGNRPVSKCGRSHPKDYHDGVEWLHNTNYIDPSMLPDDVIICPQCAGIRVTLRE